MTESQRQRVPRVDTGELDTVLAFLGFARKSVLKKLAGLSDHDVRRRLLPTDTTLLGLVQHLVASERYWFGHHVGGAPLPAGFDDDNFFTMTVAPERSTAEVMAEYRAAGARSDALVREAGDLAAGVVVPVDGVTLSLRWVLAHMTSETARHAGHADVLRELIDGTTGR